MAVAAALVAANGPIALALAETPSKKVADALKVTGPVSDIRGDAGKRAARLGLLAD